MPRQVVPLIFGAGMDRASGLLTRQGNSGLDLRNVYLYRDKLMVRHGHNRVNLLVDSNGLELDAGILVSPLSAEQIGLVAGYGSDGRVHLFRVGGDGTGLSEIGVMFQLSAQAILAGAHTPPRLFSAEQYNKIFLAHDEPTLLFRAPTMYYDPFGSSVLTTLTADLDGDGITGPVSFRGVAPYLTYVVGWGWGTETDQDRPEVVRVSDPEDPTSFAPDDYFEAGTGGSPVLNCLPAGTPGNSCILVMKPTQVHQIFGYDKLTFGIRQIEDGHGLIASRLAFSRNGVVYFWDLEGPRRSSGGPSEDLAWPLDLDAPTPADLVAEGIPADAFCCYLPGRRCLLFVFGPRIYVLNLWDETQLKWSYGTLPWRAQAGNVLYTSDEVLAAPTGNASAVSLAAHAGDTDNAIDVTFTNNGLTGAEVAEIWGEQVANGSWGIIGQAPAGGVTGPQTVTCTVQPGTNYSVQVRYRRGPYYGAAYEGAPGTWPAVSLSSNQVLTTITTPVLTAWWRRTSATSQQTVLKWTAPAGVPSLVKRNGGVIATIPAHTATPAGVNGVFAVPYFGAGGDDRQFGYDGCDYVIAGAPYTLPLGVSTAFPAGTIPAGLWGAFQVTVDSTTVPTIVAAPGNAGGYASEALALAALPAVPAGSILLQQITMLAGAGGWHAGTDSVQGGSQGVPATLTCWYGVDPLARAGELTYTDVGGAGPLYEIECAGADTTVDSAPTTLEGFPAEVTPVGTFTTCGTDNFKVAWTNNTHDLVQLTYIFHAVQTFVERTLATSAQVNVPGATLADVVQPQVGHVQTHFGVDDLSPAPDGWAPQSFTNVPC